MAMQTWRRLPHLWIEAGGLKEFQWREGAGADNAAALMLLAGLVHHADPDTGLLRMTYDGWHHLTGLSRAKISRGLSLLTERGIIARPNRGRSEVQLLNLGAPTFAKFPARGLYNPQGRIKFFLRLNLRGIVQLDLLKLWFLFCSRRNTRENRVDLTYDTVERYSGIARPRIRNAISLAIHYELIIIEKVEDKISGDVSTSYRIRHIEPYEHAGTARAETSQVPV